jgi:predicted transcriptional regulator of viral defense system
MRTEAPSDLSSYLTHLLSEGRIIFTPDEAQKELGISHGSFLDTAERLQRQKKLLAPRRGFYVVVPPQFSSWGAPPPQWYLDALMHHEAHPYYVALLKAAELHGATHQAVMEFQVVTDKHLPRIQAGRSTIAFYYRKDIAPLLPATQDHKTETGSMKISSVELTALDLLRYPHAAAGLDNIVTALTDLVEKIDPQKLALLARSFPKSVVQRLGHLLDRLGHKNSTGPMLKELLKDGLPSWVELDPEETTDPDLTPKPVQRDRRWNIVIRRDPEVDE